MNINQVSNQSFTAKYLVQFNDKQQLDKFHNIYKQSSAKRNEKVSFYKSSDENELLLLTGQDSTDYDRLCTAVYSSTLHENDAFIDVFKNDAHVIDLRA